jgi:DNA invertase Pin-like site-specific DNA recombinase
MNRIIAYLRTSTDKQDLQAQKLEILEYAQQYRMQVDDFIAISILVLTSFGTEKGHRISKKAKLKCPYSA